MHTILNPREEEVMRILWKLQKAFVKDILAEMDPPAPVQHRLFNRTETGDGRADRPHCLWQYASIPSGLTEKTIP